jgi:hypothetical protein
MNDLHAIRFMQNGCQYYATARFAMHAQCMPVCGNLFHHAVEMMLKAGLARKRKLAELKDMKHRLKVLWRAFKADFPDHALTRHDKTISSLDKFEAIRYPDVTFAIGMTGQWWGPAAEVKTYGEMKTPKQFAIVVSDIDDLIVDVFKASSWNPTTFVGTNPANLEAITRHNNHSEFLTSEKASRGKTRKLRRTMSQFYINEADLKLCERSRDSKTPITVMGRTDKGLSRPFKGVVQSIEHDTARDGANKVRVTMCSEKERSNG